MEFKVPDYKKIGRPSVMTQENLEKLCYAFSIGLNDSQACLVAEIHPTTLCNYQKRHPEFVKIKRELQEYPIAYLSKILYKGVLDKPDLALKVLEKLSKKYQQKQVVELDNTNFESVLIRLNDDKLDTPNIPEDNSEDASHEPCLSTAEQFDTIPSLPAKKKRKPHKKIKKTGGHDEISEEKGGPVE